MFIGSRAVAYAFRIVASLVILRVAGVLGRGCSLGRAALTLVLGAVTYLCVPVDRWAVAADSEENPDAEGVSSGIRLRFEDLLRIVMRES